jgi:hypothetical protein
MKKPTKKQVVNTALFAASFIPAVRGARIAVGAAKIGTKVYKAKKADASYKASKDLYDHVSRKFRRQDEEIFKAMKKRK